MNRERLNTRAFEKIRTIIRGFPGPGGASRGPARGSRIGGSLKQIPPFSYHLRGADLLFEFQDCRLVCLTGAGLRAIEKTGRFGAFWPNGGLATIPLENRPTCAHRAISFNMNQAGAYGCSKFYNKIKRAFPQGKTALL